MIGRLAILAIVIVGGAALLSLRDPPSPSTSSSSSSAHEKTGCSASRRAVEARLKSPGSAKWVDCTSTTSGGVQTVTVSVDSQNSYGGLMRTTWVATVRDNNVLSVAQVK